MSRFPPSYVGAWTEMTLQSGDTQICLRRFGELRLALRNKEVTVSINETNSGVYSRVDE